jgi:cytochrome c-type biogenesis protein CcmF
MVVWGRVHRPLQAALLAGVVTVVTTSRIGYVVFGVIAGVFVISAIVDHLLGGAMRAAAARGGDVIPEIRRMLAAEPGFWAGQLSHVGVALIAIALSFTANLADRAEVRMTPGESVSFAGLLLTYQAPFLRTLPDRKVEGAHITVSKNGSEVAELEPRANFFGEDTTGITSPDAYSTSI